MSIPSIRSATIYDSQLVHFSAKTETKVLDIFLSVHKNPKEVDEEWHIEVKFSDGKEETRATFDLGPRDGAKLGDYGYLLLPRNGVVISLPAGFPPKKDNPYVKFSTSPGELTVKCEYFKLVREPKTVSSPLTPPLTP